VKLSLDRIIDAGMTTFLEVGYDGLSMRQVADRLGVQAGSLYYHVRSKSELLRLMADRVAREAHDAGTGALEALGPDAGWPERIEAQAVTLRRVLLRHPGGAILLAGSPKLLSTGALALMERILTTLDVVGLAPAERGIAADTLLSYVTGFVLQEQSAPDAPPITAAQGEAISRDFPAVVTGATGRYDQDEIFAHSVRLICDGIAHRSP